MIYITQEELNEWINHIHSLEREIYTSADYEDRNPYGIGNYKKYSTLGKINSQIKSEIEILVYRRILSSMTVLPKDPAWTSIDEFIKKTK